MEDISGIENIEALKPLLVYHFDPPPSHPRLGNRKRKVWVCLFRLGVRIKNSGPTKGVYSQNATILNCQSIFYG